MKDRRPDRRNRFRVLARGAGVSVPANPVRAAFVLAALALAGCTTTRDPSALIPAQVQASVIAEDRVASGTEGGGISVDDMLARARGASNPAESGVASPSASAPASAPSVAAREATGSIARAPGLSDRSSPGGPGAMAALPAGPGSGAGGMAAGGMAAGGMAAGPNPPARMPATVQLAPQSGAMPVPASAPVPAVPVAGSDAFFEFTFDGAEEEAPSAARAALAKRLKAARLPAKTEVTILAGPGQGTTAFDQAVLANRRIRAIKALLPEGWKASQIYSPDFPPDTVRIVLGAAS